MAHRYDDLNDYGCECLDRKVVDTSGRLGSLYDAFTDRIIHQQALQPSRTVSFDKPHVCRIFSGTSSKILVDYLENMDFDDTMRQSLLFGLVTPSGVSTLINHNQTIDENTRFLYYSYRSKMEELTLTSDMVNKIIPESFMSTSSATYMINKIGWGFEILCVIPITEHLSADKVDSLLRNISERLKTNTKEFSLSKTEEDQIALLINVAIYGSEKCISEKHTSFSTILKQLKQWQTNEKIHYPLLYSMYSLEWLFHNPKFSAFMKPSDEIKTHIGKLQHTLLWLAKWANEFRKYYRKVQKNFSNATLNETLQNVDQQLQNWLMTYNEFQDDLRKMIVYAREYRSIPPSGTNIVSNQKYSMLKQTNVEVFGKKIQQLLEKAQLIRMLQDSTIQYMNVRDVCIDKKISITRENIDAALKNFDFGVNYRLFIWYSSDLLRQKNPDKWNSYYQQLIHERNKCEKNVLIVYADFSQCEELLSDYAVVQLPVPNSVTDSNHKPSAVQEINVLLLGETGVGKSTFINAFVNYLVFDSLQQAEQSQPVVLIPISFLMTTGHDFKEVTVKFGNVDENENFEHQGQSVTQHCRSYVFDLNDRLRLRLIDTPGINDTRGIDQDDKNMQHILTYINNLSHLNAVCLLLKPNNSKLTTFFRSCINQLLTYLTPLGYGNIIFCFTNARATFFAPGDTGPLLRKMIKEQHDGGIKFEKANTFCFDSESFRYLVAKQCGVDFNDFEKTESTTSWMHSVTESFRLLKCILNLKSYNLNEWQSPKKAILEIMTLARPLMEVLRLVLYNWLLYEMGIVTGKFELNSSPIKTETYFNCVSPNIVKKGPLFLVQYEKLPQKNEVTQRTKCLPNHSTSFTEYIVTHEYIEQPQNQPKEKLDEFIRSFLSSCDKLSYFLRQQKLSTEINPFILVLEQFIKEEDDISHEANGNLKMNARVREILNSIKNKRPNEIKENCSLGEINRIIDELKGYDSIQKQLRSIIESRQSKMKANERLMTIPSIKNKRFTDLII